MSRQELISAYMHARKLDRDLTPTEFAGFLIIKFGAVEAIDIITGRPDLEPQAFWLNVINKLRTTICGD